MLTQVSFCCLSFSLSVLEELMRQYNSSPPSELKNLSTLLVELLCISDPLQNQRLKLVRFYDFLRSLSIVHSLSRFLRVHATRLGWTAC